MFWEEFKNIDSSKVEIKKFGRLVGGAFVLLGLIFYLVWGSIHYWMFIVGLVLLIVGLIAPIILLPVHKFWMGLAIVLGFLSTRIILTVVYYLVLTPIAVVGRLFGKDFIDEKIEPEKQSYWSYRADKDLNNDNIQKQY